MKALNNDSWYDRDTMIKEDELGYNRIAEAEQTPDDDFGDDDDLDADLDDDELETDYDSEADDDLLDDDEEQEDATAMNSDFVNDADPDNLPEKQEENEIPEQGESDNEKLGYPHETEVEQQDKGNDASYSEQNDVTPPRTHESHRKARLKPILPAVTRAVLPAEC
jgi:hypothetical protein